MKFEHEGNSIEYRAPNAFEYADILAAVKPSTHKDLENNMDDQFKMAGGFLRIAGPFIVSVSFKKGKDEIKTWDEILDCRKAFNFLIRFSLEYIGEYCGEGKDEGDERSKSDKKKE